MNLYPTKVTLLKLLNLLVMMACFKVPERLNNKNLKKRYCSLKVKWLNFLMVVLTVHILQYLIYLVVLDLLISWLKKISINSVKKLWLQRIN
jgi:hypothetical protein